MTTNNSELLLMLIVLSPLLTFSKGQPAYGEGFVKPVGPEYIQKASEEARYQLSLLMNKPNITKLEVKSILKKWAEDQGGDVFKAYNEYEAQKETTMINTLSEPSSVTLSSEAKTFIEKIKSLLNDMSITKSEERQRITVLAEQLSNSTKEEMTKSENRLNEIAGFDLITVILASKKVNEGNHSTAAMNAIENNSGEKIKPFVQKIKGRPNPGTTAVTYGDLEVRRRTEPSDYHSSRSPRSNSTSNFSITVTESDQNTTEFHTQ